jgi:hypothetical protein
MARTLGAPAPGQPLATDPPRGAPVVPADPAPAPPAPPADPAPKDASQALPGVATGLERRAQESTACKLQGPEHADSSWRGSASVERAMTMRGEIRPQPRHWRLVVFPAILCSRVSQKRRTCDAIG